HQDRQHQRHQTDADGGQAILDGDDLVVLAPDIFADPCLGMMQRLEVVGYGCRHQYIPRFSAGAMQPLALASRAVSEVGLACAIICPKVDCWDSQAANCLGGST